MKRGIVPELQFEVAAFGNFQGVGEGFWIVPEEFPHFICAFHVELVGVVPQATGIGDGGCGLETEHDLVRFPVLVLQVVNVV